MSRTPPRSIACLLASAALAAGCVVDGPARDPSLIPKGTQLPDATPGVLDAQALRMRRLTLLESRGVIEFRWRDADGAHFEQCDLDLFAVLPERVAVRASKVGERFLWLGCDERRWWIFHLAEKPSRLEVYPLGVAPAGGVAALSPRDLLGLAGLVELPPNDGKAMTSRTGPDGTVVLDVAASGTAPRMRWGFPLGSNVPAAIEMLAPTGEVIARANLTNYVSCPIEGFAVGDWPRVPSRIDIVAGPAAVAEGATEGDAIRIALDAPSGRGERIKDRLFRLEELQASLRPDTVVVIEPEAPAGPVADPVAGPVAEPRVDQAP
jgi:hypothetical protein